MRTSLVALMTALVGFIVGWASHTARTHETVRYILQPAKTSVPIVAKAAPTFPERPKPDLDSPEPSSDRVATVPTSIHGDLPNLPPAMTDLGPAAPLPPTKTLPTADLNADEARVRRIVLGAGGEVVSSGDATDSGGKVGRSLVAEMLPGGSKRIGVALRQALGNRVVLSEGGSIGGSSTEVRKAEDALTALKKDLEKAQHDFMPGSPFLRNTEDAYREGEKNLAEVRRTYARQRLNILLRSDSGG